MIRLRRFISNMDRYLHDATKHRMLKQYQHWKILDGENQFASRYTFICSIKYGTHH